MGFTIWEFFGIFRLILGYILGIQFGYGVLILLLGRIMINYFAVTIEEKPSNLIQKVINIFMISTIGSGYYIYKKVANYNWFLRKIFFAIALFVQGVLSIIIYQVIYRSMKGIFL
ncbi:hypothetical protein [Guptibacillus hwajinpoensis]|uniref:hypothetical protein n=1 Tax=Guptibacillus hwajinpoensis TaxID=208199 RepID=UPI00069E577B|nr:hypothetical protein [Alkalihalobacillus macyae]